MITVIRHATEHDLPQIRTVAESTGIFLGDELSTFVHEMAQLLSASSPITPTATLLVASDGEGADAPVAGVAYFAPEVMAQGVMNLLFIGVHPDARNHGVGGALIESFENAARSAGARLAIIETASDEMFAPAWALYTKAGYSEEARVRDYYDDGLHKLIFRKRF
ncbi:MAG: GNAT family N-acetyltransferase [Pseudomonadota bacterium]